MEPERDGPKNPMAEHEKDSHVSKKMT